ncbi:bifunctional 4-hydroxy-2-oxoglutarate aldolase/2-dehydro-3-deoxy-phosphogluconate aldolase [Pseudonocardia sp. GCM10023141]|uniref:bifunctional 4-hydroxy-2-oxoglutarate aldolase/2-dehydro-3-deoxy-phosphogluconate aldolase n=1 Tax=Pseudonocardia sp. GCM10023141 TaxID=3252653 RepID=UPI003609B7B4
MTAGEEANVPEWCAAVAEQGVVAIVRERSGPAALERAMALVDAGVRVVEVSLTTPDALPTITALAAAAGDRALVGAGTVVDVDQARQAVAAGARFLVAPVLCEQVIAYAAASGVGVLPGAATPTEMLAAHRAGADLVKVFPATTWTPRALADVLVALPHLRLVPTGGVGLADAPEWVRHGAVAVGIGSALTAAPGRDLRGVVADLVGSLAAARYR